MLQLLPTLLDRIAPKSILAPTVEFRADQRGVSEQIFDLRPDNLVEVFETKLGAVR